MHVLENTFFNDIMSLGSSFANALCYRTQQTRRVETLEWINRVAHYIKSSDLRLLETSAVLVFGILVCKPGYRFFATCPGQRITPAGYLVVAKLLEKIKNVE